MMRSNYSKPADSNRRGATTVEFAVVAPIVFLIIFAIFDMFSAYSVHRTTDHGLYRAIRAATLPGTKAEQLEAEIRQEVERLGLDVEKMVITHNDFRDEDVVEISIDVPLEETSWLAPIIIRNRLVHLEYGRKRENFPKKRQLETSVLVPSPQRAGFNLER